MGRQAIISDNWISDDSTIAFSNVETQERPHLHTISSNLLNIQFDTFGTSDTNIRLAPLATQHGFNTISTKRKVIISKLKTVHLNIRSLRNRTHYLQLIDFATSNKIDVLTISETWLNTTVTNIEIKIDGYNVYRLDRLHKKGGGVCAYIRDNIKVSVLRTISHISESNFHQLWLQLQHNKCKSVVICVTYRPPDCPVACFEDFFKSSYIEALALNKPIVVFGDLNCNTLKDCPESRALAEVSKELNLTQMIKTPTRITDTCQSLIDVILSSSHDSGVINTAISDHLPVFAALQLKLPKPPPCYITVRTYKTYEPAVFTADLADHSDRLLSIFSENDVNTKLNMFNTVFQSTLEAHAPIKTLKIRSRPCPYVTSEIKELMKSRDVFLRRFQQTRDSNDWQIFKESRNAVKDELRRAERNHISGEVEKHTKIILDPFGR